MRARRERLNEPSARIMVNNPRGGGMNRAQFSSALLLLIIAAALPASGEAAASRYEVGVTTITFTKTSVTTNMPRPLATIIWYPAVAGTGSDDQLGRRDADVVAKRFPWIVFSHGNCGLPSEASYLTKALAARGFIVAAPPHAGNTKADPDCNGAFADSAANRVPDIRFVIDSMLEENANPSSRFADRLRPEDVGISGLSFGGFTTLATAQQEPRLRAALAMVVGGSAFLGPNDITIPTMLIGAEHDHIVGFADSLAAYERLAGPRFLIELLAADHLSVTNDCFPLCLPGDIPQDKAHRIIVRSATAFFRHYLAQGASEGIGSIRPMPRSVLTADPRRSAAPSP
jgi:predicted dienelactone hydrolase